MGFSENDRSAVSTKVPNFVPGSISNLDNLNTPNCPLSSPSSPEVSDYVRLFQHEESPNSIALRLCSSGLNSPITPDKTPIKPRVNNIDIFVNTCFKHLAILIEYCHLNNWCLTQRFLREWDLSIRNFRKNHWIKD